MVFDPAVPATNDPLESKPVRDNMIALGTQNAGPTTPPTPLLGEPYYDPTDGANHKIKVYNGVSFVTLFEHVESTPVVLSALRKVAATLLSGSSSYLVTHNLGTKDVIVDVQVPSGATKAIAEVNYPNANQVQIVFTSPLAVNGRVIIVG